MGPHEIDVPKLFVYLSLSNTFNLVFMKTSHGMQKCHKCRFLEDKETWLELVFGGNFPQLHNLDVFSFVLVARASDTEGRSLFIS